MRQFKLINALGLEFDLMRKDAFLHSPDGLGFSNSNSYERIGSSFFQVEEIPDQPSPSGEMVFRDYKQYSEFSEFISKKPLQFCYKPIDKWYYLDVVVSHLTKSEKDRAGLLICPIDFEAFGKWYIPRQYEKRIHEGAEKKYPYTYDYTYSELTDGIFDINNNGMGEAPLTLSIFGPITKPSWSLAVNNRTIASGSVNVTIPAGHKLVMSSRIQNERIKEYDVESDAVIQNLSQLQDFDRENIITAPAGASVLRVTGEGVEEVRASLEVFETYDTV